MPSRPSAVPLASIALVASAPRRAVEAALATLEPTVAAQLRDRYLGPRLLEDTTPAESQRAEVAALAHFAAALDVVAPASDGTPWHTGAARALLRMVGAGQRLAPPA